MAVVRHCKGGKKNYIFHQTGNYISEVGWVLSRSDHLRLCTIVKTANPQLKTQVRVHVSICIFFLFVLGLLEFLV